jgi:biotin transport system substrate-specific component
MNITTNTQNKEIFSTRSLVMMAMFAAILCISAYISITLPNGSHITFLNFIITLIVLLFPSSQALCIIGLWLLMGIIGIPVFAGGNAGIGYVLGPWGGYNIAFMMMAFFIPLTLGKKYSRTRYTIMSILSVILVDVIGSLWLMALSRLSVAAAFAAGFLPFIILDLVKAVVAAQIVPVFRKSLMPYN